MKGEISAVRCPEARELASAWIDGRLEDERSFLAHKTRCSACDAYVADLISLRNELITLATAPAADVWPRIAASAAARAEPTRSTSRTLAGWLHARRARSTRDVAQPARSLAIWPRLAAAFIGSVGTFTLLWKLEPRALGRDTTLEASLVRIAEIEGPPVELRRATDAPERQLLLALIPHEEAGR